MICSVQRFQLYCNGFNKNCIPAAFPFLVFWRKSDSVSPQSCFPVPVSDEEGIRLEKASKFARRKESNMMISCSLCCQGKLILMTAVLSNAFSCFVERHPFLPLPLLTVIAVLSTISSPAQIAGVGVLWKWGNTRCATRTWNESSEIALMIPIPRLTWDDAFLQVRNCDENAAFMGKVKERRQNARRSKLVFA